MSAASTLTRSVQAVTDHPAVGEADVMVAYVEDRVSHESANELVERCPEPFAVLLVRDAGAPRDDAGDDASAGPDDVRRLTLLTAKEREVLTLTADGLSIKEIAGRLHRSATTIAKHRNNIMSKIGLHDKVSLARFAIRVGLVKA